MIMSKIAVIGLIDVKKKAPKITDNIPGMKIIHYVVDFKNIIQKTVNTFMMNL